MTDLQRRILAAMPPDFCVGTTWLSWATGATYDATQAALHDLDDQGQVLMRGGLYRLSQAARKRLQAEGKA